MDPTRQTPRGPQGRLLLEFPEEKLLPGLSSSWRRPPSVARGPHVTDSTSVPTSPSLTPVSPSRSHSPCGHIGPTWLIQGHLPRQKP